MSEIDHLIELERRGCAALSTGGAAWRFYEKVLDDQVTMLLPGGMVMDDRSEIIEAMSGPPWDSLELHDARVLKITDDVGIVAYRTEGDRQGSRYSALFSSTYAHRGGEWKMTFHQQTPG